MLFIIQTFSFKIRVVGTPKLPDLNLLIGYNVFSGHDLTDMVSNPSVVYLENVLSNILRTFFSNTIMLVFKNLVRNIVSSFSLFRSLLMVRSFALEKVKSLRYFIFPFYFWIISLSKMVLGNIPVKDSFGHTLKVHPVFIPRSQWGQHFAIAGPKDVCVLIINN